MGLIRSCENPHRSKPGEVTRFGVQGGGRAEGTNSCSAFGHSSTAKPAPGHPVGFCQRCGNIIGFVQQQPHEYKIKYSHRGKAVLPPRPPGRFRWEQIAARREASPGWHQYRSLASPSRRTPQRKSPEPVPISRTAAGWSNPSQGKIDHAVNFHTRDPFGVTQPFNLAGKPFFVHRGHNLREASSSLVSSSAEKDEIHSSPQLPAPGRPSWHRGWLRLFPPQNGSPSSELSARSLPGAFAKFPP